ncbi:MAG TPA: GMC family oxidoreductase [Azospirillum sp.]|nr:GMC family oxidoreductase [Azospirillum sp.]
MLIEGDTLPSGAVIDTDICIVGAGAAGITLALEFDGTPLRVALLEAGNRTFSRRGQSHYAGTCSGVLLPPPTVSRLRFLGGSTNRWAGLCRPLDPLDFERRDWIPDSGWPIGERDLHPYYARAAARIGLPNARFDAESWAAEDGRLVLPLSPDRFRTGVTQVVPTRFGEAHRPALARSQNVRCHLDTSVVDIVVGAHDDVVHEVAAVTTGGRRLRVRARVFVLACGGVENARLLLNADRVRPAGLGNGHGHVGRWFMEHRVSWPGLIEPQGPKAALWFYSRHALAGGGPCIEGSLRLAPELARREGLLNTHFSLEPFSKAYSRGGRSWVVLRDGLRHALRGGDMVGDVGYHLRNIARDIDCLAENRVRKLFGIDRDPGRWLIKAEVEQAPTPDSRVTLTREVDALGLRRVDLHWRTGALDRFSVRRAIELLGEDLERLGIGRARVVMDVDEERWSRFDHWGNHHCGTTRMSASPRDGVVDPNGRVHELANLYVAGNSVFPTEGTAPPTFTTVALSIRLAEHLVRVVQGAALEVGGA